MSKKFEAQLELLDMLHDMHIKIGKAAGEVMKSIEEKQYHNTSGKVQSILVISTELQSQVKLLVTQNFKPIFDVKPETTQTFDEINEKKDKVVEWLERLKKTAVELRKVVIAEGLADTESSRIKILGHSLKLFDTFMDNSFLEFHSLSRAIFLEYGIWEMRRTSYKDEVQEIYRRLKLHPRIRKVSETLFKNGSYRNAILDAFIEIEKMTREKSGLDETGHRLFGTVFNANNPILRLNSMKTVTDKDEQRGFMFIFQGASVGIRNPKAHDTFIQKDPYRTLEYLCLASLLAKRVDESKK